MNYLLCDDTKRKPKLNKSSILGPEMTSSDSSSRLNVYSRNKDTEVPKFPPRYTVQFLHLLSFTFYI